MKKDTGNENKIAICCLSEKDSARFIMVILRYTQLQNYRSATTDL